MPRKKKRHYGDYCEMIGGELYASVSIPLGNGKYKRRRKKVSGKTEARNWALGELDRARHGADESVETFADLAAWYSEYFLVPPVYENNRKIEGSRDWQKQRAKLARIAEYFGVKLLTNFSEKDLLAYSRDRRRDVTQTTVNRDLALIRTMFRRGRDAFKLRVPRFPIQTGAEVERDRVMSIDEEQRLLAACAAVESREFVRRDTGTVVRSDRHKTNREHLAAVIIFAVDTGMRQGEMFKLEWRDVTTFITVRAEISKTGKPRKVPITNRVRKVLDSLPRDNATLFNLKRVTTSFRTACKRAGITDLRFHDLRHTATTRMIAAGIPYPEVMKITGHTQLKTFLRYLNPEDDSVLAAASRLDALQEK